MHVEAVGSSAIRVANLKHLDPEVDPNNNGKLKESEVNNEYFTNS